MQDVREVTGKGAERGAAACGRAGLRVDYRVLREERGAVTLPLIALGAGSLLLVLVLGLNSGLATLGRTQLQVVADNAARAGLLSVGEANKDNQNTPVRELQRIAQATAREVAAGSSVIQGGIDENSADLVVELGRFNLARQSFSPVTGTQIPTAVRVTARRSSDASSGGFMSLVPLRNRSGTNRVQSDAVAIASLRCKNLVFVVDVSGSFAANVEFVQGALTSAIDLLETPDTVGLVAFAGRVIEDSGPMGIPISSRAMVAPDNRELRESISMLREGAMACNCLGTDIAAGLQRAERLFAAETGNQKCEDLAVVLSDGAPVGSTPGATRAAGRRLADEASIATVAIGADAFGARLLEDIVSGFGQPFRSNFEEEDLASKTVRTLSTIPPILVR